MTASSSLRLVCYVQGGDDQWEGLCPDFDLAVQGRSNEEVKANLKMAIDDYLDYVSGLPEKERNRFLNRRAPFLVRARLAVMYAASLLCSRHHNGRPDDHSAIKEQFTVQCPA